MEEEIARLRRALDSAIYSLEQIKRRALSGAESLSPDWDCLVISEAAEVAIDRIADQYRPSGDAALHPALDDEGRYHSAAAVA